MTNYGNTKKKIYTLFSEANAKIYNPFSKRTNGNITEIDLYISAKKRKLALTYQNHVTRAKKKRIMNVNDLLLVLD